MPACCRAASDLSQVDLGESINDSESGGRSLSAYLIRSLILAVTSSVFTCAFTWLLVPASRGQSAHAPRREETAVRRFRILDWTRFATIVGQSRGEHSNEHFHRRTWTRRPRPAYDSINFIRTPREPELIIVKWVRCTCHATHEIYLAAVYLNFRTYLSGLKKCHLTLLP